MGLEVFNHYECDGQMKIEDVALERRLTHLSLFSGIGGMDLAAEWAGFKTVGQCEFADYPTKVLEKHWPDVERWRDIHELHADEFVCRTGIRPGELTCISGGFPCQPHSVAGLRKASSDERDLWPEYRRIVGEIKPGWVVAENVRGLLSSEDGRFFRGILRDFSDLGYDVGWCCYRAADVGAVHSRQRIGIIAHSSSQRLRTGSNYREERYLQENQKRNIKESKPERKGWKPGINKNIEITSDSCSMFEHGIFAGNCKDDCTRRETPEEWSANWLLTQFRADIFTGICGGDKKYCKPLICRDDDGFPFGMDRDKCLGNAVVPQQFYPIFQAIADIELGIKTQI